MRITFQVFLASLLCSLASAVCRGQPVAVDFELVASWNTSFGTPTRIVADPTNPTRMFVLEQSGRVRIVQGGVVLSEPFLDLRPVISDFPSEEGLLGMAFAPDYATSGMFYVHYYHETRHGMLVERYRRSSDDPARADPLSGETVLFYPRVAVEHFAGWIGFSPLDGLLYVPQGDQGGRADLVDNFAGKVLRIDVTPGVDAFPDDLNRNFGVPETNPFVTTPGARPEIFAMGLRNPFCCAFDAAGDLYIADVGEATAGGIYVLPHLPSPESAAPGLNFGWPCLDRGLTSTSQGCQTVRPRTTFATSFSDVGARALIGGFVYRGSAISGLQGRYVYGDYASKGCFSYPVSAGPTAQLYTGSCDVQWHGDSPLRDTTAFGEGLDGELYISGFEPSRPGVPGGFRLYKLVTACATADVGSAGGARVPDGLLNNNDFVAFIDLFFQPNIRADRGMAGGVPGRDGIFDNNDFIVFIDLFFGGCR